MSPIAKLIGGLLGAAGAMVLGYYSGAFLGAGVAELMEERRRPEVPDEVPEVPEDVVKIDEAAD